MLLPLPLPLLLLLLLLLLLFVARHGSTERFILIPSLDHARVMKKFKFSHRRSERAPFPGKAGTTSLHQARCPHASSHQPQDARCLHTPVATVQEVLSLVVCLRPVLRAGSAAHGLVLLNAPREVVHVHLLVSRCISPPRFVVVNGRSSSSSSSKGPSSV